jgi:hypothetical protein
LRGVHRPVKAGFKPCLLGALTGVHYAHEDRELARALAAALAERGLQVWIDEGELKVGDSLIERIATAIAEIDFFLALVSHASRDSNWCRKELALAVTGELGREA